MTGAGRLAASWGAALLLVLSGVLCCLAVQHRYFANGAVILLAAAAIATALHHQRAIAAPPPAIAPELATVPDAETAKLRTMLDQTPVPLVTLDSARVLHAVNRAARALFRTDDRITAAQDTLKAALDTAIPGQKTILRLHTPHDAGAGRSFALSVAQLAGPREAPILGVLTDIQAELQAAEAAALRELLQVLSHEIMNSLTPLASLAESAHAILTEAGAAGVPEAADALAVIQRRTRGLDRFVQGYRTLARLPEPQQHPSSVTALLNDAAALFQTRWATRGVILSVERPVPDLIARFDADLMAQALLNLLANAAEAALHALSGEASVTLKATAAGGNTILLVTDNGPGVPLGQEEAIFRPFYTRKQGGSGIGLALARQIALSHGGTLALQPKDHHPGATFRLTF